MVDNQNNAEQIDLEAAVLAIYSYIYTQGEREDVYRKMQTVLDPHGIAEGNIDKVRRTVARHGGMLPLAVVPEGFGFAWDEVGVPEELAKQAINLMKDQEIIVQCGRGYGKAIVLVRSEFDLFDNNYRAEAIGVDRQEEAEAARNIAEAELNNINQEALDELDDELADAVQPENPNNPRINLMPAEEPQLFENDNLNLQIQGNDEEAELTPDELLLMLNQAGQTFLNILESLQRDVAQPILRAQTAVRKLKEDMEAQPEGDAEELQAEIDRLKKELERAQMVAWQ